MLHVIIVQTWNTVRTDWISHTMTDWLAVLLTMIPIWLTRPSLTIPLVCIILYVHVKHATAPTKTQTTGLAALPAGELVPLLYHLFGGHVSQGHGVVLLLLGVPGKDLYLLVWSSPVLRIDYPEFWAETLKRNPPSW